MKCKALTKLGTYCRNWTNRADGFCPYHAPSVDAVTVIDIPSKELGPGQVRRRKALSPRPRRWAYRHTDDSLTAHRKI